MNAIVYAGPARRDLGDIWEYIFRDSEKHADALLLRIDETVRLLSEHRHIERARPEIGRSIRSFTVGNYVIFYRPLVHGVRVMRVMHGSRRINLALR